MTQAAFDWTTALRKGPVASSLEESLAEAAPSVRMAPAAIEARRSGRRKVVSKASALMLAYRDGLRALQPATDHEVSAHLRRVNGISADDAAWGLSSINGRRNDWLALDPTCIVAVDRVRVGGATRARWQIRSGGLADTWGRA